MLLSLTPRRVENLLTQARQAGLNEQGSAWMLRGREMRVLMTDLLPALRREVERGQGLG
jgi:hypothetical protein